MSDRPSVSVTVVRDGATEARTWRVSYRRLRFIGAGLLALITIVAASGWYLAARSARVAELEEEVGRLRDDRARVAILAARLEEVERRYAHIRDLFGSGAATATSDLWLPPSGSGSAGGPADDDLESAIPTSWPLSERGFVTQPLLEGARGSHPGIDIAVPADTYIRAAGAGTVVEAGEDDVYGRYLVIDHGNGYRTRYAHASALFVEPGSEVRRKEVVGLSGSTGRSTAPHLHFEILLEGEAVDPLTLVRRPS